MKKHRIFIGVIIVVSIPLYFLSPFTRDLWIPDEPRYAEVAMEMAERGNWIVPHLQGEVYTEKPPLYFWILAGSAKLFGSWHPFAMIAPAAFSAIGCVIVTYVFVMLLFHRRTAFLSSLILMTSLLFVGVGQMVRMDMLLILCINLSLLCFYRLYLNTTVYDWVYALGFFLSAALGTLTKGPIGLGLPGLIIVIFLFWTHILRRRSGQNLAVFRKMHLVWGSGLYLAIVLVWFVPAVSQQGWAYAYLITIKQNLGRVYNSWSHARPWYFYLYTFPWITLPWFPFFVSATVTKRMWPASPQEQDALTFLWIWWSTTFLFFSLVSGKLEIYLLPLFPPTAMIVGRFWTKVFALKQNDGKLLRSITYPAYFLGGLLIMTAVILIVNNETRQYTGGAIITLWLGAAFIYFALRRYIRLLFGALWSFTPIVLLYGMLNLAPVIDQQLSLQPVVRDLHRFNVTEGRLALWQSYFPARYYLPIPITLLKTYEEKLAFFSAKTPAYCLTKEKYLNTIRTELNRPIYILATYRIQRKRFVLISQYPGAT